MRNISEKELRKILEDHKRWLDCPSEGVRANLSEANLRWADLSGANLYKADLYEADLYEADLSGANLYKANLYKANLSGANLYKADLRWADLSGANLSEANLRWADLSGANLSGANLYKADLYEADLSGANLYKADLRWANLRWANLSECKNLYCPLACPEKGAFIAFKKANGHIVELRIPASAKRCSATSRKCRCNKAKVLSITTLSGEKTDLTEIHSDYDSNFIYRVGEYVTVDNFNENRWDECSAGIHFFITRQEAVDY